jgi:hypothetical protein
MSYQGVYLAAAGLLAAALAVPASAVADVTVSKVQFQNGKNISLSNGPLASPLNTQAGNFLLTATTGDGTGTLWAFCVDLAHTLANGNYSPPLKYNYGTFTHDSFGKIVPLADRVAMKALAAEGFRLLKAGTGGMGAPGIADDIQAIQAAIWKIEYGASNYASPLSYTGGPALSLVNSYIALATSGQLKGTARYIYSLDNPLRQGLFVPGVPEPATWAMLIAGFGLVGSAIRRRRAVVLVSA